MSKTLSANQAVDLLLAVRGMGDRHTLHRWVKEGLIGREFIHTRCAVYDEAEIRAASIIKPGKKQPKRKAR